MKYCANPLMLQTFDVHNIVIASINLIISFLSFMTFSKIAIDIMIIHADTK